MKENDEYEVLIEKFKALSVFSTEEEKKAAVVLRERLYESGKIDRRLFKFAYIDSPDLNTEFIHHYRKSEVYSELGELERSVEVRFSLWEHIKNNQAWRGLLVADVLRLNNPALALGILELLSFSDSKKMIKLGDFFQLKVIAGIDRVNLFSHFSSVEEMLMLLNIGDAKEYIVPVSLKLIELVKVEHVECVLRSLKKVDSVESIIELHEILIRRDKNLINTDMLSGLVDLLNLTTDNKILTDQNSEFLSRAVRLLKDLTFLGFNINPERFIVAVKKANSDYLLSLVVEFLIYRKEYDHAYEIFLDVDLSKIHPTLFQIYASLLLASKRSVTERDLIFIWLSKISKDRVFEHESHIYHLGRLVAVCGEQQVLEKIRDCFEINFDQKSPFYEKICNIINYVNLRLCASADAVSDYSFFERYLDAATSLKNKRSNAVLFCVNRSYLLASLVAIKTFCDFNRDFDRLFIFHDLSDGDLNVYESLIFSILKSYGMACSFVNAKDFTAKYSLSSSYGAHSSGAQLDVSAYYRIFAAKFIKEKYDHSSLLYLDSDAVILGDMSFVSQFFDGSTLKARLEVSRPEVDVASKHLSIPSSNYFNSGVLGFNFLSNDFDFCIEKTLSAISSKTLFFHDQCALNYGFHGSVEFIDKKYNCFFDPYFSPSFDVDSEDIRFIHYLDRPKPWVLLGGNEFSSIWYSRFFELKKIFSSDSSLFGFFQKTVRWAF